ncbi:hypothetical protein ARMGADRAFT_1166057 [Armillaria gallica]|uniref:Uncharacterized protein n=1 Tax=Armillaria gallica TaxID=47427 RepID=A0A2H3DUB1_ARMGA|nr:hypothetical protein ARMGADRAFT_1166057 [Armillaria gallica]
MEPTLFKSYSGALGLRAERHLIFSPSLLHRSAFLLLLQQRSGQDSYMNMGRSVHFVIVALMAVALASASIVPRGPQTNATCSSDYDWTDNKSGLSPCLLASYLIGSCLTGDYGVWALPADSHYDPPNVGSMSSTPCSCSWSVYNLLSACTVCQGDVDSIPSWGFYKDECPDDDLSTTAFFPYDKGYELSDSASIPYWATQNPLNWTGGRFDSSAAKNLASQGHPDLTSDDNNINNHGSSTPVGAVVGGVVGGLAVLSLAAVIAFFLFRRHRRNAATKGADRISEHPSGETRSTMHLRSNSAMTQLSDPTSFHSSGIINMMNQPPPLSPQSLNRPTLHSRSSSSDVGGHGSYFGSVHGTSALMSPTTAESQGISTNLEDIITPFTGFNGSLSDHGTAYHIDATSVSSASYESGSNEGSVSLSGNNANNSTRMNPPAYSRYPHQIHQTLDQAPLRAGKDGMQVQNPVGSRPHSVVQPPPPSDISF